MRKLCICSILSALLVALIMLSGCSSAAPKKVVVSKETKKTQSSVSGKKVDAKSAETDKFKKPPPKLQISQEGITLRWMDKGKLRMVAQAKEFRGSEVTKQGELIDFTAKLYENGKVSAIISAPKAVADTDKRIVTATGGVKLKSVLRSTSLTANWIKWYAKDQKVVGNGGVTINSTMGTIKAAAFEADTGLKKFIVKSSGKGLNQ